MIRMVSELAISEVSDLTFRKKRTATLSFNLHWLSIQNVGTILLLPQASMAAWLYVSGKRRAARNMQ